jgi:predicted FMN-binding regulatory protein PaiB
MSQNRPAQDRAGVVDGLVREERPANAAVARIVAAVNKDQDG